MDPDADLLHRIRIASPCAASWDEMRGDDRARFCEQCRLNVYNLSEMSAAEAAALVREKEGRLCVRYYARSDGTMLTRDCPVGFRAARRLLLARMGTIAAAFVALFASTPLGPRGLSNRWLGEIQPFRAAIEWFDSRVATTCTMGFPAPIRASGETAPEPTARFEEVDSIAVPIPPSDAVKSRASLAGLSDAHSRRRKRRRPPPRR